MLDIYTLGGGEMLHEVMMGIASVTGDDSFMWIVAAMALFGVVIQAMSGLPQGRVDGSHFIKFFLILMTAVVFLTPTAVRIIDVTAGYDEDYCTSGSSCGVYEMPVGTAGNGVSFGVAAVSSLASTAGYQITKLFQVFLTTVDQEPTDGMAEGGYSNATKVMQVIGFLSDSTQQKHYMNGLSENISSSPFDYGSTIEEWTTQCYEPWRNASPENKSLAKKHKDASQEEGNFFEAVAKDIGTSFSTFKYLAPATPGATAPPTANDGMVFCNAGQDSENATILLKNLHEIDSSTGKFTFDAMNKGIGKEMLEYGKRNKAFTHKQIQESKVPGCHGLSESDLGMCIVQKAGKVLLNYEDSKLNNPYLMMSHYYMANHFTNGQGRYAHATDSSQMAAQLEAATMQRNIQSAADLAMWENVMPAILQFLQVFLYAVAPFAIMIFLTGISGNWAYLGKYFSAFFWIALFMPIQAMGSYFVTKSSADAMALIGDGNFLHALQHNNDLILAVQDANSVASMMLVATPLLSLMIVTGSYFAMASLAGRLSGGDHFNEKALAPDAIDSQAFVSNEQVMSQHLSGGMNNQMLSGVGFSGQSMQQASRSIESKAVDQVGRTLANQINESEAVGNMTLAQKQAVDSVGNNFSLGETKDKAYIEGAESVIKEGSSFKSDHAHKHDDGKLETVKTALSGTFGAAAEPIAKSLTPSVFGKIFDAAVKGTYEDSTIVSELNSQSFQETVSKEDSAAFNKKIGESTGFKYNADSKDTAEQKVAEMQSISEQITKQADISETDQLSQQMTKSVSDAQTASSSISQASNFTTDDRKVYSHLNNDPGKLADFNDLVNKLNKNDDFRAQKEGQSRYMSSLGYHGEQLEVQSGVRAIGLAMQNGYLSDDEKEEVYNKFFKPMVGGGQGTQVGVPNSGESATTAKVDTATDREAALTEQQGKHIKGKGDVHGDLAKKLPNTTENIKQSEASISTSMNKAINSQIGHNLTLEMHDISKDKDGNIITDEKGNPSSFKFTTMNGDKTGVWGSVSNGTFKVYTGFGENAREVTLDGDAQKRVVNSLSNAAINGNNIGQWRSGTFSARDDFKSNAEAIQNKADQEAGLNDKAKTMTQ